MISSECIQQGDQGSSQDFLPLHFQLCENNDVNYI